MNDKDKLKELVFDVNDFLSKYIEVHNIIYKESESFISTIKNFFGKGVSFEILLEYAKTLIPEYESLDLKMLSFKSNSFSNLSKDQKDYFNLLFDYFHALRQTAICLFEKEAYMYNQSQLKTKMSYLEIKVKSKKYDVLIENYLALGRILNDNSKSIFH